MATKRKYEVGNVMNNGLDSNLTVYVYHLVHLFSLVMLMLLSLELLVQQ